MTRLLALHILDEVSQGHSLSDSLQAELAHVSDPRDRGWIQAVCYGVCRFYPRLNAILDTLLKTPLKDQDHDIHVLLLIGLYQLTDMRIPHHAAVSETVNAVAELEKTWAKGLVNAVLREYLRNKDKIEAKIESDEEAHFSHPSWWIGKIKKAWPKEWEAILLANNVHPPFSLRVNTRQISRDDYLAKCEEKALIARAIPETQSGIILEIPIPVEALPGFLEGEISVQDGAAQLAAGCLELSPGLRILDACAAPGGKLTHILELESDASCLAVEKDRNRMPSIEENLSRLSLSAECICADANNTAAWWDGQLFDRILLDAPCSASGIIRRHPDIKILREPDDIQDLSNQQRILLRSLWPLLKPGGLLLYATCSIFPQENEQVLEAFLARHPDASEEKLEVEWGCARSIGRQILPGQHDMDGFYYAKIRKG